ncbi:glycosyl transferase family 1 [Williamsia sp. 1138]|uniref:glycosyltransferase family 4 protein n=1 Tax=Williamsia sp. 1138 TaxID=1903117 RepID=UPI000A10FAC6|nr:glycosyltransferase family 4 protein [Williamsia sp. 1138]OZG29177.1 glycosyl transferase family 1 [Williamsia sp. 1138]
MTRPLRVLLLIDAFRMGGAETLLAPLAVAFRDSNVEMEFVSVLDASADAAKTNEILNEAGVVTRALGIKRLLDPTAIPKVVREIRRADFDVVHAHLEMATTLAVPAAAIAGRSAVCTFHHVARPLTGREGARERLAVAAAGHAYRALFVSQASRDSFQEIYRPKGLPGNWDVMHNGIDIGNFVPGPADAEVRTELGGTEGPLVVLPAAFRDFKGIPNAIRAWPLVLERFPDAVLSLVGGGSAEAELRAEVAAAGVGQNVVFAGVRSDMPKVYRAADIVLLPSIHGENLPTVLIEAAASGRVVAASRTGGISDIVVHGETGMLFEPNNPRALADTVIELLADPGRCRTLGEAAVIRARSEFSASSWAERLYALYAEAAGKKR